MIKLCTPAMETKQDTILERIRAVEEKVEKSMEASANMQGQIVYVNGDGAQIAGGSVINGNTEGNLQALVRRDRKFQMRFPKTYRKS